MPLERYTPLYYLDMVMKIGRAYNLYAIQGYPGAGYLPIAMPAPVFVTVSFSIVISVDHKKGIYPLSGDEKPDTLGFRSTPVTLEPLRPKDRMVVIVARERPGKE